MYVFCGASGVFRGNDARVKSVARSPTSHGEIFLWDFLVPLLSIFIWPYTGECTVAAKENIMTARVDLTMRKSPSHQERLQERNKMDQEGEKGSTKQNEGIV